MSPRTEFFYPMTLVVESAYGIALRFNYGLMTDWALIG